MLNKTKYWLLASIVFTYTLIFIGGFVRVSGSGLGCPDWPKCFDRWYPPLSIDEIPENFKDHYEDYNYNCVDGKDCKEFDITRAWIEYFNRLFGMLTGIIIFITFLYLVKLRESYKTAVYLGGGALFLTGAEGLIGKYVISSHLEGSIITIHLLVALVIISLLIMSYSMIFRENNNNQNYKLVQINIIKWIFIFILIGIILGTQVRESIENFIPLQMIGPFKYIHSFLGIGSLMLTGVLWNKINNSEFPNIKIKNKIKWLLSILTAQIGLGYFMVFGGLPAYMKLAHMWLASIALGIMVYVLMDVFLSNKAKLRI